MWQQVVVHRLAYQGHGQEIQEKHYSSHGGNQKPVIVASEVEVALQGADATEDQGRTETPEDWTEYLSEDWA